MYERSAYHRQQLLRPDNMFAVIRIASTNRQANRAASNGPITSSGIRQAFIDFLVVQCIDVGLEVAGGL